MALIECYECKRQISSAASACVQCGAPVSAVQSAQPAAYVPPSRGNAAQPTVQVSPSSVFASEQPVPVRAVPIWLMIGIVILPPIFVWFLLRPGHTAKQRILGFGWLAVGIYGRLALMMTGS